MQIELAFLDKRIYKFISKARESLPKAYIELKSNGTVLSKEKILKAFNAGLDMLYINDYNDFPEHTTNIIKLKKDLRQIRRFGENAKDNNNFHRIEIGLRDRGQILGSRGGKSPNKKDYSMNPYKQSICFRPYNPKSLFGINRVFKIFRRSKSFSRPFSITTTT